MAEHSHLIGQPLAAVNAVLEHGTSALFAKACKDDNPVYQSAKAAAAAGLDGIPIPPTYAFVVQNTGAFPDLQPSDAGTLGTIGPVLAELTAKGGLILHGEQEFIYHRQAYVGETLYGTGRIADVSVKESSNGVVMTFIKSETLYSDESGAPVVTSNMTVIHRSAPPVAG